MKLLRLMTPRMGENAVILTKHLLNTPKFPQTASVRLHLFSCLPLSIPDEEPVSIPIIKPPSKSDRELLSILDRKP